MHMEHSNSPDRHYTFLYLQYQDARSVEMLTRAYGLMERQGLVESVFYDGAIRSGEDLAAFLLRPGCIPVAVFDATGTLAALTWLNAFEGKNARGHFVFFKEFWGRRTSIPLGRSIFTYFLTLSDSKGTLFDSLVGITPESNVMAYRRAVECGAHYVGVIPAFCSRPDRDAEGGVVVVVTRETLGSASPKYKNKLGV